MHPSILSHFLALFQILFPILTANPPAGCSTPTGTVLTESFGDSTTSCWTAGPTTCNNTWTLSVGTPESIVASPASAPANTACANSLQIVQSAAQGYISHTLAGRGSGVNTDIDMAVYPSSFTVSNFSTLVIGGAGPVATPRGELRIDKTQGSGTVPQFAVYGSTDAFDTLTVTAGTWYTIHIHFDTAASTSYLSVNGGTHRTFTQNTQDASPITFGSNFSGTHTTVFGYVTVN